MEVLLTRKSFFLSLTLLAAPVLCNAGSRLFQTKPRNVVAVEGGRAIFNCTLEEPLENDGVRWRHVSADGQKVENIYQSFPADYDYNKTKYTIDKADNVTFDLTVKDVMISDAGQYLFSKIVDDSVRKDVDLVVLRKPFAIFESDVFKTGEKANFTCEAEYASSSSINERLRPYLFAKVGSKEVNGSDLIQYFQEGRARISLTFEATLPDDPCNLETVFYCHIETNRPRFRHSTKKTIQLETDQDTEHCPASAASMLVPNVLLLLAFLPFCQ